MGMQRIETTVLVVEDELSVREAVRLELGRYAHLVRVARGAREAQEAMLAEDGHLLVVLDMGLAENDDGVERASPEPGFRLLEWMAERKLTERCMVLAATGTLQGLEEHMQARSMRGVYDVVNKPYDVETDVVPRLLMMERRWRRAKRPGFVANCREMLEVVRVAEKVGRRGGHVLIYGETGTGKGLLAKYIHMASERRERPMETVPAAAVSSVDPMVAQSLLFGRVKGFGGQGRDDEGQVGIVEAARDRMALLDDVQNLDKQTQQLLLNFVQDGQYCKVGVKVYKLETSNAWLVFTVNEDPDTLVERGQLHPDFLARLRTDNPVLVMPTLRERGEEELKAIAYGFAREREGRHITEECMEVLVRINYRDNIRDLEGVLVQACVYSDEEGPDLTKEQLLRGLEKMEPGRRGRFMEGMDEAREARLGPVERNEAEIVLRALNERGSIRKAADSLNKDRSWVSRRVTRYGMRKRNGVWNVDDSV